MSTTTQMVANRLVAFLREAKNVEAIEQLYAANAVTQEVDPTRNRVGKAASVEAMKGFAEIYNFHYTAIEGPLISGGSFALRLCFEATPKQGGGSFIVDELAVYTVKDGLIAHEQFFYP